MQSQLSLQRRWNKQGLIKRTVVTVADDTDAAIMLFKRTVVTIADDTDAAIMLLFHWKEIMVI